MFIKDNLNKKIMITGCNGMLGGNLFRLFKKNKYNFFGIHKTKKVKNSKIKFYLDLNNKNNVKIFIKKQKPKIVIHTAGLVDLNLCQKKPKLSYKYNIQTLKNLISTLNVDTYFIFISSDQVYGKNKKASEETKNLKPLNVYGKHKLISENLVKKYFKNYMIIRTNIFGLNHNNFNKGLRTGY